MAYDEDIADRLRHALAAAGVFPTERRMFGGIAFMVRGHMTVGVIGDELMVRVGKDAHEAALEQPHTRPMDFTGKPMAGMVYVERAGFTDDASLAAWVQRGLDFTGSLAPK